LTEVRRRLVFGALGVLLVAAVCVLTIGRGSAGDDGDGTQQREFSAAFEPPDRFMERLARILATAERPADCDFVNVIGSISRRGFRCPAEPEVARSMARFKVLDTREYGTGAVVEYRSGEVRDSASTVLAVTPYHNWGIVRHGIDVGHSVSSSDDGTRTGFERTVDAYLAAVKARDCEAFRAVAFTADDAAAEACEGAFAETADLATRLEANAGVRPAYEGGSDTFGFFTLETARPKPENATIVAIRTGGSGGGYRVLDVAPSPTAASTRAAIERYKETARRRSGMSDPDAQSGRKAD